MVASVTHGVEGYELVGHDAATTVDGTVALEGVDEEGVGKVDAVTTGELAMTQATLYVLLIVFEVALGIWLLYATT